MRRIVRSLLRVIFTSSSFAGPADAFAVAIGRKAKQQKLLGVWLLAMIADVVHECEGTSFC